MNLRDAAVERSAAPPRRDVAVYLDFENLYVSLKTTAKMDPNFELLMERCREFGRIILARAYADWSEYSRMFTSQMFANGFEPVYVPTRKVYDSANRSEARKNSVDIHITIDIIKSLFLHENVDTIILISGDRDYVPLINEIRQKGKSVYAIGVAGCTSSELSIAVDEMFFYHQLLDNEEEKESEGVDVYNQILQAIRIARRRGYPTTLGILKPIMRELIQSFHERNYKNARGAPFQKFKDLIQEGERRRLVKLVTTGGTSEVVLWSEPDVQPPIPVRAVGSGPRPAAAGGRANRPDRAERPERPARGEAAAPSGRRRGRRGGERRPSAAEGETAIPAEREAAEGDVEVRASSDLESNGAMNTPLELPEPFDSTPAGNGVERPTEEDRYEAPAVTEAYVGVVADSGPQAAAGLDPDTAWPIVQHAVESFGQRPPTPRKLVAELQKARDEGAFGSPAPSDEALEEVWKKCVESGRLKKERKGFSTVLRIS